jgi:pSer/pThr/pTyr-binding forkhead associated (FHA) protein
MSVRLHGTFGSWLLPEGETVLGRGAAATLRIDDPRLSRTHARFVLQGHQLRVEDLGATNGILVDGTRISGARVLAHGAVVVCGPVVLMVSLDQTMPHPRTTVGEQDPTTRREAPRLDTETMPTGLAADRPSAISRGLDPAIAAAVSTSGAFDPARQSSLQPAEMASTGTSPLDAIRPDKRSGHTPPPRRSPTTTSSLMPPSLAPTASGALEAPRISPGAADRLLAGVGDGILLLVCQLPALAVAAIGYGMALASSGAVLAGGLPRLAPGEPGGTWALAATLFSPAGAERALDLLPTLARQPTTLAILIAAVALAALLAAGAGLLVLAAATIVNGAPWCHRRRGIAVVRADDGAAPGWIRVVCRWSLAVLLWPLALPAAIIGARAPHDVLSGCSLVRTR